MNETPPLDLDTPRGPGQLLSCVIGLFGRHSGLFLSLTLLVAAPVSILVDGVWRGGLDGGAAPTTSASTALVATLLELLMPVLVTALHVAAVRSLDEGRLPGVGDTLRVTAPRCLAVVGASIFYAASVVAGCIAFVVPGVWLLVGAYFGAQIAVIERAGPFEAVMRSVELVRGGWWRTARILFTGWIVFALVFWPLDRAIAALHPGVLYITLLTLARALDLSLAALYGTLAYFSVRAWKAQQLTPARV